jgi:hypothetical protein
MFYLITAAKEPKSKELQSKSQRPKTTTSNNIIIILQDNNVADHFL